MARIREEHYQTPEETRRARAVMAVTERVTTPQEAHEICARSVGLAGPRLLMTEIEELLPPDAPDEARESLRLARIYLDNAELIAAEGQPEESLARAFNAGKRAMLALLYLYGQTHITRGVENYRRKVETQEFYTDLAERCIPLIEQYLAAGRKLRGRGNALAKTAKRIGTSTKTLGRALDDYCGRTGTPDPRKEFLP